MWFQKWSDSCQMRPEDLFCSFWPSFTDLVSLVAVFVLSRNVPPHVEWGGGGRREKRRGGGQGYFRLAIGEGAKHFYKEVSGGQEIDREVYF